MRRLGLAALALLAIAVAPAGAKPSHKAACNKHRHKAALHTSTLLVWGKRHMTTLGPATTYYACMRPRGKSVKLGTESSDSEYGPDKTFGAIVAAGNFAAGASSTGNIASAMCFKYSLPTANCPPPNYSVIVTNVKTRREANVTVQEYVGTIALARNGAVAWLEGFGASNALWATPLTPSGKKTFNTSPTELDSGDIDPNSIKFVGNTLYWTNAGIAHHQVIQ